MTPTPVTPTPTTPSKARARWDGPLLAALLAGCALGGPALAKGPRVAPPDGVPQQVAPAPLVQVGPHEDTIVRRLDVAVGRSLVVDLPRDAKEVFVANPKVANAVVRSARKLFVMGVENGATSIFVTDAEGRQIAALEVNTGMDLTVLRQTLAVTLPRAQIEARPAGNSILLTGLVESAAEAQQATDIAKAFTKQAGFSFFGGGDSNGNVINSLTIRGRDQVMVRVTVVEVSRSALKQLGVNTKGTWSGFDLATNAVFPISAQNLAATQILKGLTSSSGSSSIGATLQAFERAGVSRVLAEPTLVAISGEAATFTAGGEIPIPQSQTCDPLTNRCTIGVTYKPYGVNLAFTPVVLAEGRISLRVNTEVTEIDYENSFTFSQINVPAVRTRKATTTVELPSGATIMTAGLISQTSNNAIAGVPGLLNLPVLGALFRSRDYQRRETEMMIMVTPYIAQAMAAGQAARPDDGFSDASDGQAVLLGRLNTLYGVAGAAAAPQRPIRGRYGFITD